MAEPADGSLGRGGPDVFISYSRADAAFVRRLDAALRARGKDVWVDWDDIPATADWRARIFAGIESSRAFLVVLSPDLLDSEICAEELARAAASNKRVIPALRREIDRRAAPEGLLAPNWIFFRDGDDFERSVDTLVEALETDLEWLESHARLLVRATEWEREGHDASFLLRGSDLKDAETWLADQGAHREAATPLQAEFVVSSRRGAVRRQRALFAGVTLALAVAIVLGVVALIQRNDAIDQAQISRSRELAASAVSQLGSDPELSVLLAREALDARVTPQAAEALVRSLRASHLRLVLGSGAGPATSVQFDPAGRRVVAAAGKVARIWDAVNGRRLAVLRGHRAAVTWAAFDGDGSRVVTASEDRTARVWDARTGKQLAVLSGHRRPVTLARFSPDGRLVLTASEDGRAGLWNAATGKRMRFFSVGRSGVTGAVFSRDGRRIATTRQEYVAIWDGRTGEPVARIHANPRLVPEYSPSLSPDGRLVLAADWDVARVWNATTGKLVKVLRGHSAGSIEVYVHSARFSPDGVYAVTSGADGTARVWGVSGWREVAVLSGHAGEVKTAEFSADSWRVLTVGDDGTARVWDPATGESLAVLRLPGSTITSAAFSPDGNRIATTSGDGVRVWEASGFVPVRRIVPSWSQYGQDAVFSPDGTTVASVSDRPWIELWRVPTGTSLGRLHGAASAAGIGPGRAIAFSSDGARAVTALGKVAVVSHVADGTEVARLRGHRDPITSVAFAADGSKVLTTSDDGTARVWDAATGRLERVVWVAPRSDSGSQFAFSPDGGVVVAEDKRPGGGALVRDVATRSVHRLRGDFGDAFGEPSFSPDGSKVFLSTGPGDAGLEPGAKVESGIWDVAGGAKLVAFAVGPQVSATFSDDGRLVLTSDDDTARVWDARTGEVLATIRGHESSNVRSLASAAFSPDGRLVITAGTGGAAKVWGARTGEHVATLRALSDPERGNVSTAGFSPDKRHVAVVEHASLLLYECEECRDLAGLRELADARAGRTTTAAERARLEAITGG